MKDLTEPQRSQRSARQVLRVVSGDGKRHGKRTLELGNGGSMANHCGKRIVTSKAPSAAQFDPVYESVENSVLGVRKTC